MVGEPTGRRRRKTARSGGAALGTAGSWRWGAPGTAWSSATAGDDAERWWRRRAASALATGRRRRGSRGGGGWGGRRAENGGRAGAGGRTETSREERSATEHIGVGSVRRISTDGGDPHIDRIFPSGSAPTRAPPHPNILKMGSTRPGWISSTNQTHGK